MVLTGRGHAAFAFACNEACCAPGARQVVTTQQRPLSARQKLTFILAVSKCFTKLPVEVLCRIFDFAVSVEHTVGKRAPIEALPSVRSRHQDPLAKFELDMRSGLPCMDSPAI